MGWPSLSDVTRAVSNTYNGARDAVTGGAEAVRSTVVSGATAVRDTAVRAASTAADLGGAARDRAVDLARTGADLGRRGVEAVRGIDVREAAATVRRGIGDATEAARDGISTATRWTSERVGDAADWSRSHVDGDGLASRAVRGAITTVESGARFQLGVTGGLAREVVGTVGAAGQLATTGVEMQVSAEARVEYGRAIVDGVAGAAGATGDYLRSVANDPGRLAGDAGGAWDAASGFVGDTASRYGQAIAEGRTEEIGMDVGTVASYVVPVGGGPVRGALTAAVRGGGEVAARGAVTTLAREGGEALARESVEVAATRTGATLATREGGEAAVRGTTDLAVASRRTGVEGALYRDATTGARNVAGAGDDVAAAGRAAAGGTDAASLATGTAARDVAPVAADGPVLTGLAARTEALGGTGARFGIATSNDYRATFFAANPGLQGKVVVHHAVEQQVMTRYPGVVSNAEMHSLENLRGIPKELNSDLHLSQIRREWNQFYRQNADVTQEQLLAKATEIDNKLGSQFNPPR